MESLEARRQEAVKRIQEAQATVLRIQGYIQALNDMEAQSEATSDGGVQSKGDGGRNGARDRARAGADV